MQNNSAERLLDGALQLVCRCNRHCWINRINWLCNLTLHCELVYYTLPACMAAFMANMYLMLSTTQWTVMLGCTENRMSLLYGLEKRATNDLENMHWFWKNSKRWYGRIMCRNEMNGGIVVCVVWCTLFWMKSWTIWKWNIELDILGACVGSYNYRFVSGSFK